MYKQTKYNSAQSAVACEAIRTYKLSEPQIRTLHGKRFAALLEMLLLVVCEALLPFSCPRSLIIGIIGILDYWYDRNGTKARPRKANP